MYFLLQKINLCYKFYVYRSKGKNRFSVLLLATKPTSIKKFVLLNKLIIRKYILFGAPENLGV